MLQGLYIAASGMMTLEARQEIIANNVANAATPGYKRHTPVQLGFYEMFTGALRNPAYYNSDTAPAGGVKMLESYASMDSGALVGTGNPLNVGLSGRGYIAVNTPRGERFTRNGAFTIDAQGDLATAEGYKVQSVGGQAIQVEGGPVVVGSDGTVSVGGEVAGQIRVMEFEQPQRMLREGDNLLAAEGAVMQGARPAEDTQLVQQELEMSNVNMSEEMVGMILGMRAYEANQRVVQAYDETLTRLIEQVGTPS